MQSKPSWLPKPQIQSLIAFSVSSCLHLSICLTLALVLISTPGGVGNALKLGVASPDDSEDLTQLVDLKSELTCTSSDSDVPALQASASLGDLTLSLDAVSSSMQSGDNSKASAEAAEAASTEGNDGESDSSKSKSQASFYGAQADGNRFVFVIDSSQSMQGDRWESLCKELIRALQSLSPDQDFFIISFDSLAHPMFGVAPSKGKFLKPAGKNVQRVQNWLRSIQHGNATFPASAVGLAMQLSPDAIFLLSDGEIRDSTVQDLRLWNREKDREGEVKIRVPIHTVLLHSLKGYATLETIATENGGTFTPVQPR